MESITPLYEEYKNSASITNFAKYALPLMFRGIIQEHLAVRNSAGFFDVSHMGRFVVEGPDASAALNHLVTVDITKSEIGRAQYTFICNANGGVIDDLITYKLSNEKFIIVVNASNREKDLGWILKWTKESDVAIKDITEESILIAVQGPMAKELAQTSLGVDLGGIRRFRFQSCEYDGHEAYFSRTGYTGEDGYELLITGVTIEDPRVAIRIWRNLMINSKQFLAEPCGLGARDTLRIEAGLPLYGNELTEEVTPIEAGLIRFVDLNKEEYIGKNVHLDQVREGTTKALQGLRCLEDAIPRSHYKVLSDDLAVGYVTSGTFSPIIKKGIAMAFLYSAIEKKGELSIEIRDRKCKAEIHQPPFYEPELFGWRRQTK